MPDHASMQDAKRHHLIHPHKAISLPHPSQISIVPIIHPHPLHSPLQHPPNPLHPPPYPPNHIPHTKPLIPIPIPIPLSLQILIVQPHLQDPLPPHIPPLPPPPFPLIAKLSRHPYPLLPRHAAQIASASFPDLGGGDGGGGGAGEEGGCVEGFLGEEGGEAVGAGRVEDLLLLVVGFWEGEGGCGEGEGEEGEEEVLGEVGGVHGCCCEEGF
ncbi:hypothetical protein BDR22DRAFT_701675 [Usnea florida]